MDTDAIPELPRLFEDELLLVVNKPSGMLSQPGKQISDSVQTRVLDHRPGITGPALVHRLDMDTSGIMVLAKNRSAHRHLAQQFERRLVHKRYFAVLEREPLGVGGAIHLPVRLDPDNRPHQVVCFQHGKAASTVWFRHRRYQKPVITFFPLSGRTHQLRVHAASVHGLDAPIAGDNLYGSASEGQHAERLMLHAEGISFEHPGNAERIRVHCEAPFKSALSSRHDARESAPP